MAINTQVEDVTHEPGLTIPEVLPVLPLRNVVIYPMMGQGLTVGQERSVRLVDDAMRGDRLVALAAQIDPNVEAPGPEGVRTVGTVGRILQMMRRPDGVMLVAVQGLERIRLHEYVAVQPYLMARVELYPDSPETGLEVEALRRTVADQFRHLVELSPTLPDELAIAAVNVDDPRALAYLIANSVSQMDLALRQEILELNPVSAKLQRLTRFLTREIEVLEVGRRIQGQAREEIDKTQREYILREQLRAIQRELGEEDEQQAEVNELRSRLDEAGIRGHRRTYIGAMPGTIIQAIRRAEANDPVFMLDEIDKVGADWRGDPSSALLEVLDPEQNKDFRDNYLDLPFDLSRVMFITTANTLDTIPAPLQDRMEVLQLAGYTEEEKLHIARRYLVPKQMRANGLTASDIVFTDEALRLTARSYTREAGVRNLERQIATLCRKVAREISEGAEGPITVDTAAVGKYLGRPQFEAEVAERTSRPGVATGMVYTPVGGEITLVDTARVASKEEHLILTGQLGDVMRESAQAALTCVRSLSDQLGISPEAWQNATIHIHVPAGAVPKDGPSAGVTIATALASLMTGRPVRHDVAMTGEITLRGKVLPIGGLKEKVLGAHRAGITTIIFPRRNERDLEDIPDELRRQLTFLPVDDVSEVLDAALTKVQA